MRTSEDNRLVSVIVPVYKVPKYIDKCVESIINQDYKNLEIILVDDGSPDNCGEMCDNWAKNDNRIIVIHKENGGLSDARNAGIEASHGEILSFVDSDDWIESNMISKNLDIMDETGADYCACNIMENYEKTGAKRYNKSRDFFVGDSEQALARLYNDAKFPASAVCKLVKRETWGDLRFPVGKLYEDGFTTYLMIDRANKIAQIPDPLYNYRIRENSIMTGAFNMKHLNLNEVWKTNYLFVKDRYPNLADAARAFWLEHLPGLIAEFPKKMTKEEKQAKAVLKKEIKENLVFAASKMGPKKTAWLTKALFD